MPHRPYIRTHSSANPTIVMIHGIVGSPRHFDFLIPLIPDSWNVYNLLLPGHGQGVREFGQSSMSQWKAHVAQCLDAVCAQTDTVLVVAHSMGTLFAIEEALRRPQIRGLFLLAVPLCPFVRPKTALASCKLSLGLGKNDPIACAMSADGGVTLSGKPWAYFPWIPRFVELLLQCRRTCRLLPRLQCPTIAFESKPDELVALRSYALLQQNPSVEAILLTESGHFRYSPPEAAMIKDRFSLLLQKQFPDG